MCTITKQEIAVALVNLKNEIIDVDIRKIYLSDEISKYLNVYEEYQNAHINEFEYEDVTDSLFTVWNSSERCNNFDDEICMLNNLIQIVDLLGYTREKFRNLARLYDNSMAYNENIDDSHYISF